ncbi:MAG: hypothetical protein R8P61_33875 [Bacteroidia bacterium]|nr:hypothetical protein [Bacteroidia bacterium]
MSLSTAEKVKTSSYFSNISANQAMWGGIGFSTLFTVLIWALDYRLDAIELLPDTGAAWYKWKLPEASFITRFSAWGSYTLHQVLIWGLIYQAQKSKLKYSKGLHPVNVAALVINAVFIFWHLIQTHVWYDGLAQDVSVFSSQWSVIILLVAVLLMENQRRGLFFGKKVGFLKETGRVVRKYHGYVFSWGIIYTFWFHPMEGEWQHLIGFFYMFLLMIQSSLFFTQTHVNKYWMIVQEVTVTIHGTMVAYIHGQAWPMFLFGFLGLFIITQMHGLGLKKGIRWFFAGLYVAGIVLVYSQRGWDRLDEILRISIGELIMVFMLAAIVWVLMKGWSLGSRVFGYSGKI